MNAITEHPEYRALLEYAARIGRDPLLVQAAGGNVSFKHGDVLWVKASGTWLADAGKREIMVPVHLEPMLRALDTDAAEQAEAFVVAELNAAGLRPSIETTMHGALPHPVVVHVHSIGTIVWAVRRDAEAKLTQRLAGLNWRFVPYVRPGAPLTRAILAAGGADADVLVLGNHGLVVGAADTAGADRLVAEVGRRLRREPRVPPPADTVRLCHVSQASGYTPADDTVVHAIATDHHSLAIAKIGSLYPDHVIFLGPGIAVAQTVGDVAAARHKVLAVPDAGVLLRKDAGASGLALARCLADVAARLEPHEPIVALRSSEEQELLGWDAEKYRQATARA